eukprot:GHVP01033262.1.p1 GENE.GHVP01033262.1~~GHVP01033262.1.p1  ORF type:complete len:165 (-),score=24.96 GHVP01033262.1:507-1001(-)
MPPKVPIFSFEWLTASASSVLNLLQRLKSGALQCGFMTVFVPAAQLGLHLFCQNSSLLPFHRPFEFSFDIEANLLVEHLLMSTDPQLFFLSLREQISSILMERQGVYFLVVEPKKILFFVNYRIGPLGNYLDGYTNVDSAAIREKKISVGLSVVKDCIENLSSK